MSKNALLAILLACILAACGDEETDRSTDRPSNATPENATISPVIVHLQRDYESLLTAQSAISEIWEQLADGQQVQCGQYPEVLAPESISAEDDPSLQPLADILHTAAIATEHAVQLWQAECRQPRQNPPPDVLSEGLLAVRSAGDALKEAEPLLTGIQ